LLNLAKDAYNGVLLLEQEYLLKGDYKEGSIKFYGV